MATWHVIGRGWNGWHAEGVNVSGTGGDLCGYVAQAFDGATVYDARGDGGVP